MCAQLGVTRAVHANTHSIKTFHFRHSREGCSRGFAQHAVCLRNDWLLQKPMRPARGNPVNRQTCLDSRLRGNDGIIVFCKREENFAFVQMPLLGFSSST